MIGPVPQYPKRRTVVDEHMQSMSASDSAVYWQCSHVEQPRRYIAEIEHVLHARCPCGHRTTAHLLTSHSVEQCVDSQLVARVITSFCLSLTIRIILFVLLTPLSLLIPAAQGCVQPLDILLMERKRATSQIRTLKGAPVRKSGSCVNFCQLRYHCLKQRWHQHITAQQKQKPLLSIVCILSCSNSRLPHMHERTTHAGCSMHDTVHT